MLVEADAIIACAVGWLDGRPKGVGEQLKHNGGKLPRFVVVVFFFFSRNKRFDH